MQPLAAVRRAIRPEWSHRNFDVLMAGRVAMSTGRALAGVVTPIYLALQGFDAVEIAAFVVVVTLTAAVLSTAVGMAADRLGRRPFLIGTPLLAAAAGVAFATTGSHAVLFVMGAVGSFGRGMGSGGGSVGPHQPAEAAFAADTVGPRHRNHAFGRLAFGSSLGATAGGLFALLVRDTHVHGAAATAVFRPAFLAVAALSAFAGLVGLALVEERPPGRRPRPSGTGTGATGRGPGRAARGSSGLFRIPKRSRWLLYRLCATNAVNGAAVGMVGPFVTYWFYRRFGAGAAEIGVLFAVINAASMVSTLSAAGFAGRWGLVRTVTAVRIGSAALLVPMVLAPSFAIAGGLYLIRMLVQRISLPLRQSYAAGLAEPEERAAVTAISGAATQLAIGTSPLATGYLFEEVGLSLPFEIGAALQMASVVMFWAFFRSHPPEEERGDQPAWIATPVAGASAVDDPVAGDIAVDDTVAGDIAAGADDDPAKAPGTTATGQRPGPEGPGPAPTAIGVQGPPGGNGGPCADCD